MSIGRSEPLILPGLAWPVEMIVHPRARRLRLRLDEKRGLIRLTCPPRASRRAALAWAQEQAGWVEAQLARMEAPLGLTPGAIIPIDGEPHQLEWREGNTRTVRHEPGLLWSGGRRDGFGRRIERWIRAEALRRLSLETAEIARAGGIEIRGVAVGDAVTRWGSCSTEGRLRYNFRLVMAPPHVRRFVVAHEVAHRRHMDHGPAFHALEAQLFGGPVGEARLALRRLGPGLRRIELRA